MKKVLVWLLVAAMVTVWFPRPAFARGGDICLGLGIGALITLIFSPQPRVIAAPVAPVGGYYPPPPVVYYPPPPVPVYAPVYPVYPIYPVGGWRGGFHGGFHGGHRW